MATVRSLVCGFAASVLFVVGGCSGNGAVAPVGREAREPIRDYVVQKGDTLYYIAWRFAKDYTDIARYNSLTPPYTIYAGQRVRLDAPPTVAVAPVATVADTPVKPVLGKPVAAAPPSPTLTSPAPAKPVVSSTGQQVATATPRPATPAPAEKPARAGVDDNAPVTRWTWPARGTVLGAFGSGGGNGIQIAGTRGQSVVAAAPGTVVYSGSGLIGYGKLIIIKHNKNFLSAYAHNDSILANEGDRVDLGQQIAQMGSTGADRVKLHFEIRRDGKPVDPKRYLPD